ncbi:MAG TPA: hypothetical protein VFN26_03750 [Candidatus Acidoferrum sp.]|nr:hypothetical protein [Candidatus Acidoferrum sp.]
MENTTYSEWPIVKANGELMLLVPLAETIGSVQPSASFLDTQGNFLKIVIPEWLAEMLEVEEGDLLRVSNADGEFQIQPVQPRLVN